MRNNARLIGLFVDYFVVLSLLYKKIPNYLWVIFLKDPTRYAPFYRNLLKTPRIEKIVSRECKMVEGGGRDCKGEKS